MPGNTLISSYLAGLRRQLPADLADEAAGGLAETYEHHLARGYRRNRCRPRGLAESGDLAPGGRRVHPAGPRPPRRPRAAGHRARRWGPAGVRP